MEDPTEYSLEEKMDDIFKEFGNQETVVLSYDSDEEHIGEPEIEQFDKALRVLEESDRATKTVIGTEKKGHYGPRRQIQSLYAVVSTENLSELQEFVGSPGEETELAVKRGTYDIDPFVGFEI